MIAHGYELDLGFVIPLGDLWKVLIGMSEDRHQWDAVPVPYIVSANDDDPRRYVAIGYSNPDSHPSPNYLAFLFPMLAHGIARSYPHRAENLLVCLHPQSATPLSRGLYIEDGEMKYDTLDDWDKFWRLLKEAIRCALGTFQAKSLPRRTEPSWPTAHKPKNATTKRVFACFSYRGTPHFVRVREATQDQQQLAREYLSKVIPYCYYEYMIFVCWSDGATEYHELYPDGPPRAALRRFLTDLSSKEEVIKHAAR